MARDDEDSDERRPGDMPGWVEKGTRSVQGGGRGAGAGMEFGAAVVVFTLLGLWADRAFGTRPWLMLVGLVLGFGGGLVHLMRALGGAKAHGSPDDGTPPE
jgi:ATP synthase protein I